MKRWVIIGGLVLAVSIFMGDAGAKDHRRDAGDAIQSGANRLLALQADITADNAGNGLVGDTDPDDGGWDYTIPLTTTEHSGTASPENTYGVTAQGLLVAYDKVEKNAAYLVA